MKSALSFALFIVLLGGGSLAPAQLRVALDEIQSVVNLDGSITVQIPASIAATCIAEGGCAFVSRNWVLATISTVCGHKL
jgi:hypothetical protein